MKLNNYDLIIINSSGGKDSLAALYEVCRIAKDQDFPFSKIAVSHQDLGSMEWEGTKELVNSKQIFLAWILTTPKEGIKMGMKKTFWNM